MADNTGAAFGVFPQMRPRRALQDREAAANAPLSALRGWAAGTAGLPGDIEGLLRMLVPGVSNEPALPTSEFYKEWLPGRSLNETPTGRAFTEAGGLTGGAGLGSLSRAAATGVRAGGRGALSALEAAARNAAVPRTLNPQAGVIKMKGGNWLSGSVEDSLKRLKSGRPTHRDEALMLGGRWANDADLPEVQQMMAQEGALNNWIDKKLASYVKNEMATPEDPVRALAEKWAVDKPAKLAEAQARIDALASKIEQTAGQRGVPPEYLTSMRQQMIGLEKEKDLLQLREGLHYTPENITSGTREVAGYRRSAGGYPPRGSAVSDLAKAYETMTDFSIGNQPAGEWRKLASPEVLSRIPGLERIPDEAIVYERTSPSMTQNLGFNHLIDELRNATNPDSGLPKELLLKYQDLPKITLPQAVDRVADINAWRAAQKVEADMARANNAATQVFKEYPDKGFKWVELKQPEPTLPEGYSIQTDPRNGLRVVMHPQGYPVSSGATDEEAIRLIDRIGRKGELEDALKYEGDTMQHCVGGYCPDVLEGRSRIFSLRSAKGQPHVTVEVKPYGSHNEDIMFAELTDKLGRQPSRDELIEAMSVAPQRIIQIKGKANRAPNPEYLPYVQDFVKSGKWSDVGDIENAGLRRTRDVLNDLERKTLAEKGHVFSDYMTEPERQGLQQLWDQGRTAGKEGFAQGGLVQYDPAKIDALTQQLQEELYAA